MVKLAMLSTGNNINGTKSLKTVPGAELLSIVDALRKYGFEVDIFSNKDTDLTKKFDDCKVEEYDAITFLAGTFNLIGGGGRENSKFSFMTRAYKILADASKERIPLIHINTDKAIRLDRITSGFKKFLTDEEKEELEIISPIHILSFDSDEEYVRNKIAPSFEVDSYKFINMDRIIFQSQNKIEDIVPLSEKKTDLVYIGSNRSGRRKAEFKEYLTDTSYGVQLYGTITKKQLDKSIPDIEKYPEFGKKISPVEMSTISNEAVVTLVCGEKNYSDIISARVWQSAKSSAVVLIDEKFDSSHAIFPKERWRYVNNSRDVEEIIEYLKDNEEEYIKAINAQHERVKDLPIEEELKKMGKYILDIATK